ncbi:MBL fold metallo-hydrolase [Actinoallomurus iriomotensis]|uniref:MBL fold metallo-hydrolase n=1 Tax=Actinoallomurus iriomotensis TaxID=478107 RepID=A0A9W6VSA1_9ACTN|nr:MBL fold metallo-hydrolase [Actinoallomurus iriomotensis]GLY77302.1 MBL fold metallo-hydrolase [Actinoallomurus iriomotensis]
MRITVIGCSGSFPGPDSPASCYLVQAGGFALLLDLGSGALGALQNHIGLYDIDAILFTHLHADHCLDLCGYWVARKYAPDGLKPRIPVYGPGGVAERMARAYDLDPEPGMSEAFDFRTLAPGTFDVGPFTVTAATVNHPVEAYGFRVEYEGAALAYTGDTGECEALVDLARGVDLLLAEASFVEREGLPDDLHLTARQAGVYATRADAGRLVLTHLVPWNDPGHTLAEAKSSGYRGHIELASQGAVYDL